MTVRTTLPMVSATLAFASDVPLIADACSLALMTLSPATLAMLGAFGTTVSTVMSRVVTVEVLPATSVAWADSVSGPWSMAEMSAAVSV